MTENINPNNQAQETAAPASYLPPISVEEALAAYKKRKTTEAIIGPAVSFAVHVLFFLIAWALWSPPQPMEIVAQVEITSTEEEQPEEIEDIEDIELPPPEENIRELRDTPVAEISEVAADVNTDQIAESTMVDTSNIANEAPTTDFTNVMNVQSNNTDFKISGLYAGRTSAGRKAAMNKYGGKISGGSESAVLKALMWLKKTQNPDGSWSPSGDDYKAAMTGLCLLAFLAHGEDPSSKEFGTTVANAMQWLCDKVNANGGQFTKGNHDPYVNGIVAYALSEAYGMTKLAILKEPMEATLERIVKGQQRSGGFDYNYKTDKRWDLSVGAWQYQALKAGYVAGAEVKGIEKSIDKGINFIRNVAYAKKNYNRPYGYTSPGGGSDGMQGAGTLCLQLLGEGNCEEAKAGVKAIYEQVLNPKDELNSHVQWSFHGYTNDGAHSNPLYYWYYCTQAMFHAGGKTWKDWNDKFSPMLVKAQKSDGHWDFPDIKRKDNTGIAAWDPWYTTSLSALSLQVYYRYLPSYKLEHGKKEAEKSDLEKLDEDLGF